MRKRLTGTVAAAAMISATAVVAMPTAADTASGPAACMQVRVSTFSAAQLAATRKYWTAGRIGAAEGVDHAGRGKPATPADSAPSANQEPATTTRCAAPVGRGQSHGAALAPQASAIRRAVTAGRSAQAFQGYPSVGELFEDNNGSLSTRCTASTISPAAGTANPKNLQLLILTAAHCVDRIHDGIVEAATNLAFAPQYDSSGNDNLPYGLWTVRSVTINSGWTTCSIGCPPYDYAILVLEPLNGGQLGSIVGANGWSITEPKTIKKAQIVGYTDTDTRPLLATTKVIVVKEDGHTYREAESTPAFGTGTSGSPFFAGYDTATHVGTVFGDIGGYQQGGKYDSPSYSPCWTSAFARLVAAAFGME